MKNKKAKSKIQAILIERKMKIVDLFNKIQEQNKKPVAKYMISQIVEVSPNQIIEDNPSRYSASKGIKSNTPKETKVKRSGRIVVPKVVDVDINMHSGNGYIDDIIDENGLEDIKRTLNLKDVEEESAVVFDDRDGIPTMRDETEEERDWEELKGKFNPPSEDVIDKEQNWKDEIINDKDNKWGNGSIKEDEEPVVEKDEDEDETEEWRWETKDERLSNDDEDDFGF